MAEKVLKCYKCTVENWVGSGRGRFGSYGIEFYRIFAYSKAEAMRIAERNVDQFKKCKIEQEVHADQNAVPGTMERI